MLRAEVQLAWKTQAGHRHNVEGLENEDAVFVTHQHPTFDALLMVADGMGGHPRPREASEIAVRAAREFLFDARNLERTPSPAQLLAAAVRVANEAVSGLRAGAGKPPGTTLSIAAVAGGVLYVAHVGDGSVYLMRGGRVRAVAGGEAQRTGNRPSQYLGQAHPLELEQRQVDLAAGDRLLLCTDGLTRYFREAGPEALEWVVGRSGVEVQSIVSQLTAHSRPGDYDDDTTVALAEVTRFVAAPRPAPANGSAPRPQEPAMAETSWDNVKTAQSGPPIVQWLGVALGTAALLALGFVAGRLTASTPLPAGGAVAEGRQPASAAVLQQFPSGNVVLVDELGRRVFTLATRGAALGSEPVEFRAFRVNADGRFEQAGRYRLDPARGVLSDAEGRKFPVELDYSRGSIHLLRGGTLSVRSRPEGATVRVNGRDVGRTPQQLTVPAGRHTVRVEGRNWVRESEVQVPAGGTISVSVGP